jgi:Transglycosylase SLT domain
MSAAPSSIDTRLNDAIPTLVDTVPEGASPSIGSTATHAKLSNQFDSTIDASNDGDIQEGVREPSSIKPPVFFKRTFTVLAALLTLLLLCVLVLFLPWTKVWLDTHDAHPALAHAVNVAQSIRIAALGDLNIRVADQQDPARSAPSNLGELTKENVQIATFFAKKYRLAASEVEKYIHYALRAAKAKGLEPTLILAVMSIESNLNSITESPVGAQGLMQVLTAVHLDKLAAYGGSHTVFDPEVNVMVGATVLADCIKLGGSIEMGLKCYVGATGPTDNGYGAKVLAEKERIEKAKLGVYDFASNNKVLIDMGLMAANPDPMTQSGQTNQNTASSITQVVGTIGTSNSVAASAPPIHAPALTSLIPSTVTALPALQQASTTLHNTPAHSVSGTVKQERAEAAAPQTQK